jgi:hypothetical protein
MRKAGTEESGNVKANGRKRKDKRKLEVKRVK